MRYETILERLTSYKIPGDWPPTIFLLPEPVMKDIYTCVVENKLLHCIELGTGHGATSCVIAAALEELEEGGHLITIDKTLHLPVNANVLKEHTGIGDNLEFIVNPLGYNWYLADLIEQRTSDGVCEPLFDFCLIDGAHEFEPDALAFTLVACLLKPGGWVVLDDVNFSLRTLPFWQKTHGHLSDRELDTCQIGMVYDYIVKQHPDFTDFHITEGGRVGWTRKKPQDAQSQLAEKDLALEFLQSQLAEKEAQLTEITGTFGWRLLNIYGRFIKYPFLLPIYRLLGLTRAESKKTRSKHSPETELENPEPLLSDKCRAVK